MKSIKIPEPVILVDADNKPIVDQNGAAAVVTFKQFVGTTLLVDPKFGKTLDDILSAVEIKTKLSLATDTLDLDNADWDRLVAVAKEPTTGYNPAVAIQLVPFFLAIKNAR